MNGYIFKIELQFWAEWAVINIAGPPWQGRQARFGPSLDFGFQYALIRNNWSKKFGVEY